MKLPRDVGPIHFIGIGGIGMSGIAEVMATLGYKVQGSDLSDNYNVARLRKNGIEVLIGHQAANIGDAQVVVVSSAVKPDNPELVEARARYPADRAARRDAGRTDALQILRGGRRHPWQDHDDIAGCGTCSMPAGFDPTVINGGIINAYGTNARLGKGDWMVVESDESDGTFVKLPADVVIVTNIDPEHLDHYGSFEKAKEAFLAFVENIPFYGFAVMCIDHPEVQALIGRVQRPPRHHLWPQPAGGCPPRRCRTMQNGETKFAVRITDRRTGRRRTSIDGLTLADAG